MSCHPCAESVNYDSGLAEVNVGSRPRPGLSQIESKHVYRIVLRVADFLLRVSVSLDVLQRVSQAKGYKTFH
jgi:hypothetical protein